MRCGPAIQSQPTTFPNTSKAFVASHTRPSDHPWPSHEFCQAYRGDPERKERKQAKERKRQEERAAQQQKQQREQPPPSISPFKRANTSDAGMLECCPDQKHLRGHVKRAHKRIDLLQFEKRAAECSGWQDLDFWRNYRNHPTRTEPCRAAIADQREARDRQQEEPYRRNRRLQVP